MAYKCACCDKILYDYYMNAKDYVYKIVKDGKKKVYCSPECFRKAGGSLEKEIKGGKGKDAYPQEGDTPTKLVRRK